MLMNEVIRSPRKARAMSRKLIAGPRQAFADVTLLVTTAALVLSLAVAATAVSIGIARATSIV
jgi:hypothetical protein